ncbi:MAG: MHYT domain-containing protein, partial [Pseudomonadota bacterium]
MSLLPKFFADDTRIVDGIIAPEYDIVLVAASLLMAAFTSYFVLRLVGHLRTTDDRERQKYLIAFAGITLGGGIWSMHFTGMLALELPVEVTYDPALTVLSLLIPIAISTIAIYWIRAAEITFFRLATSGVATGTSIVVMHYLGMAAIRAPIQMSYDLTLFLASIAIAYTAAVSAFWFARRFSDESLPEPPPIASIGTACLMACAISGMHYCGMAAMIVVDTPSQVVPQSFTFDPHIMAGAVAVMLLVVICAALLALAIEENTEGRIRLAMLPLLMGVIACIAGGISVGVLYDTAIRLERARLTEFVRAQRELIEAVARFDAQFSTDDVLGGAPEATLSQIRDAHERVSGFGQSGEFYLARRRGGDIEYVVPLRFELNSGESENSLFVDRPMQLALRGMEGSTIGLDYRSERVLAAHWERLAEGTHFDGMESWVPWLVDDD